MQQLYTQSGYFTEIVEKYKTEQWLSNIYSKQFTIMSLKRALLNTKLTVQYLLTMQ